MVAPDVTTTYTVTVTEILTGETDEADVVVTIIEVPIDAGSDATICEEDSFVIGEAQDAGYSYLWTSVPFDSSLGDTSNPNPTVTPTETTIYTLKKTSDILGCFKEASVTITVEQLPVISAGIDATICSDQTSFTLSSASGPATGVAYQWQAIGGNGSLNNPTLLNPTYTIDSNDTSITFQLTAQNNLPGDNCPAVTDEIVLTIEELVSVSAGANGSICATGYLLNSATATNATSVVWSTNGTGTFSDNSALQPVYTPSAADVLSGSVDLTLTATNNCGSEQDIITKTIVDTPTVNAGIDITISQGATADLSGITTNASSVLWTFTGGSGTLNNPTDESSAQYVSDPTDVGPITLTLTAQPLTVNGVNCGSAVVDTLIISINPAPTADAGDNRAICLNEVTTLGVASTPGYSYEWTSVPFDGSLSNPFSSEPNVQTIGNYRVYRNRN